MSKLKYTMNIPLLVLVILSLAECLFKCFSMAIVFCATRKSKIENSKLTYGGFGRVGGGGEGEGRVLVETLPYIGYIGMC